MSMKHQTNIIKRPLLSATDRVLAIRVAQVWFAVMGALLLPATANAALSDWFTNLGKEVSIIIPIIIAILAALGLALAGFGIFSAVMAKKNQRPLEFQLWFIVGGVLLLLLIPFVAAVGESVSGEDAGAAIQSVL